MNLIYDFRCIFIKMKNYSKDSRSVHKGNILECDMCSLFTAFGNLRTYLFKQRNFFHFGKNIDKLLFKKYNNNCTNKQ